MILMAKHENKNKIAEKKDKFDAKLSFILSLGFVIPLFNIGLCIVSLVLAINSIRYMRKYPEKYEGLGYAITAIVISLSTLILSIIFIIIYIYRKMTCDMIPKII